MGEEMLLRKEMARMEKDWKCKKEQLNVMVRHESGFLKTWEKRKKPKKGRKSGEIFDWLNKRVEVEKETKEKKRRKRQEKDEFGSSSYIFSNNSSSIINSFKCHSSR